MDNLEYYLTGAKNFENTNSTEYDAAIVANLLKFCRDRGLVKVFDQLILTEPKWVELASKAQVEFFVEARTYKGLSRPTKSDDEPTLALCCFCMNTVPTIKVTVSQKDKDMIKRIK